MPTLFVVMPAFNEPATLGECVRRVLSVQLAAPWIIHIVLVDDGSEAQTARAAEALAKEFPTVLTLLRHSINRGKGAALQTGFAHAIEASQCELDAIIIQDADLEYDPHDFVNLLAVFESSGTTNAVFGNRWHRGIVQSGVRGWIHMRANRLLTSASNLATGLKVHDMECCYKLIRIPTLRMILPSLTEQRFGIEPQIAAALAQIGATVCEIPVSYEPRSFQSGKKIGPIDGIRAIWVIIQSKLRM